MIDVPRIRKDFPILKRTIGGKKLVYLDSTATSLKPQRVINAIDGYYKNYSANVFRGIYGISEEATKAYEDAREKIARFIHAKDTSEVVFTRGSTESLNLLMYAFSRGMVTHGDEIVTTIMEHHSNFVPWQQMAKGLGLKFSVWNINKEGQLNPEDLNTLVTKRTKVFTMTSVSNVLGTVNPVRTIVTKVKRIAPACMVIVDAAQSVPHAPTDVSASGADFVVFSGHKMLGPTGIGVLWGKMELLEKLSPFHYGGEMITEVSIDASFFKSPPHKFEGGTPHIAGAIGLGAAADYLSNIGMENIRRHEKEITSYALSKLANMEGLTVYGPAKGEERGGVVAFTMRGIHPHDIAQVLDTENVCIRSGNHCAMPLHTYLNVPATARASFYVYTTHEDIDRFVFALEKSQKIFFKKNS